MIEPFSKSALAVDQGKIRLPRGKVLGGSSMLNWMLHVRGHSDDFNEWADLGNPGWAFDDVLPYFKKSQNMVGNIPGDRSKYHGEGGPLGMQEKAYSRPIHGSILNALREMGHAFGDVNGDLEGGGFYEPPQEFLVRQLP